MKRVHIRNPKVASEVKRVLRRLGVKFTSGRLGKSAKKRKRRKNKRRSKR